LEKHIKHKYYTEMAQKSEVVSASTSRGLGHIGPFYGVKKKANRD
jgi:hypothetical protein